MTARVIAIGLDCGDAERVKEWISQGCLEGLRAVRAQGAWCQLEVTGHFRDEAVWTEVLCGCRADKTGFFSPFEFLEGTYDLQWKPVYDYQEYPLFYDLDPTCNIAAFDVPHCSSIADRISGIQVLSWGAHYPTFPRLSSPKGLWSELADTYGTHPAVELINIGAGWWDETFVKTLFDALIEGASLRATICRDLLRRDKWDLFFTVISETHEACHHFESPDHPCSPKREPRARLPESPMLELYQVLDRELFNRLAFDVDPHGYLAVFSITGSTGTTLDLANAVILPEFLYRLSFPGNGMFPDSKTADIDSGGCSKPAMGTWSAEMWRRRADSRLAALFMNPFAAPIDYPQSKGRLSQENNIISAFASKVLNGLRRRLACMILGFEYGRHAWIPASWYKRHWPAMKAFALPSTEAGRIRFNVKGREPHGLIEPEHYDYACEELISHLRELSDARTGTPAVKDVIRWRRASHAAGRNVPDEDLTVVWNEVPFDAAESPKVGRIGPFPFCRLGSHNPGGFLIVSGPGIEPGSTLPSGDVIDLAPTILNLMGVQVPDYFDGKPLLAAMTDT
jgi:predicted AlkP superfamily phosphohydrolase/phosphomutase